MAHEGTCRRPRFRKWQWMSSAGLLSLAAVAGAASQRLRDVPADHWAAAAIQQTVDRGLMSAPAGVFQPNRPVTRAELAVVLVRMIDAVEKAGPRAFDKSPALHDVPPAQVAKVNRLPAAHWATPAYRRLVVGGYLSPPDGRVLPVPTLESLDRPAQAGEVADAITAVVLRMEEKKVGVLHPEALKEGVRPETRNP